jgi:hypothetical protein
VAASRTPSGYFPRDTGGKLSVNTLPFPGTRTVTVDFGGSADDRSPSPVMEGWSYLVRLGSAARQ